MSILPNHQNKIFCNWLHINYDTYQCAKCGQIVSSSDGEPPILPCVVTIDSTEPDAMTKIKNFSQSLVKHSKNGFKLADDSEIERRFEICKSCEFFNNDTCNKCGCPIARHRAYISKLSWDSEHCPVNKW